MNNAINPAETMAGIRSVDARLLEAYKALYFRAEILTGQASPIPDLTALLEGWLQDPATDLSLTESQQRIRSVLRLIEGLVLLNADYESAREQVDSIRSQGKEI